MNNGPVRYGNAYSPYPYGNPDNNDPNASTTSLSSFASTSSKVLGIFKSKNKDKAPPVPEKDYPYMGGRNALPSTSNVSITLSDAGTTASSSYSSTTGKARERAAGLFKVGKRSKKNVERDLQSQQATISGPWNVKHEIHIDDGLKGFPPEWQNSLLQLGYSPEEIQQMMEKKRRNPSVSAISVGAGNSAPSSNASSSTHHTTGSTSTSAHYNYPTPPQQYALPVPSQYSSSAYQPLTLQTDATPAFSDLDQVPSKSRTNSPATYASQLRNPPERSDSPASSIRSGQRSLAGDQRASPVQSLSREHVTQSSNLAGQPSNPFKLASPSRPPPPPPLFPESSISIQKANTYKPLKVIAVNGNDSDDENELLSNIGADANPTARIEPYQQHGRLASTSTTASRGSADPPTATRKAPSKSSISSLSNVTLPSSSATNPNIAEGPPRLSLGIPRISLSLGSLDLGAGLDLGGIKESNEDPSQTVEWSESLFAALPSATAFDGFRTSVIRSPGSGQGSSGRGSPASNYNGAVGESAGRASPGANSPFTRQSPAILATSPLTGSTFGPNDVPLRSLAREPSPITTTNTAQKSPALVAPVSPGPSFIARTASPASSTPESSKPTVGFNTATSPNQQQNREPHPILHSPSSAPNDQTFPVNRESIASSDSTLSPGRFHYDRDPTRESISTYSARESLSTFGEMDYDDGDGEHEEEVVVVARATAVTLARAPSMALHRNFDAFAQGGKGINGTVANGNGVNGVGPSRDVIGKASAQAINVRARGLSDAPPYAALQAQRMLYQNAGFDDEDDSEEEEDEEEEEEEGDEEDDPDSRHTIRLGDADAGRLMDAVMRGGGILSEEQQHNLNATGFVGDTKREMGARKFRPLSTATITKEARNEERPTSTATIQGVKIACPVISNDDPPGGSVDTEVGNVEGEGEEDSSALDDWLEANDSDDSDDPDAVPPSAEDKAVLISPSKGDGSEYDDADHPLLDAYTSLDTEDDRLEGGESIRSPESQYDGENSRDSTYSIDSAYMDETASQSLNNRQSVLAINSGQIVAVADAVPDSPFVLTPDQMSAVSSQGTRQRASSKSGQTSGHERTPGAGSGFSAAGSYRLQRSSMIYAPGLKGSSNTFESMASTNHMSPSCREILKPLMSFIRQGNPCSIYCGLQQVAEGESGGIFAAQALSGKSQTRVAIKKVRVEENNRSKIETLRREMTLFSRIRHENMLTYGEMWLSDDASPELWIRMDLMERSLADLLGLLPEGLVLEERHVARFAMDVTSGLAYLEKLLIAHRDIRSDNLLVSAGGCTKLADFANAIQLAAGNTQRTDEVGIVYWQAPEMRRGSYDAMKVDVWSLGATVWELIEGETPFENDLSGPHDRLPELTNIQEVSQGLLGFLHLCEMPPTRRPSARELIQTPFIRASCSRADVVQVLSRAKILEEAINSG